MNARQKCSTDIGLRDRHGNAAGSLFRREASTQKICAEASGREKVQVPTGNVVALETTAAGVLNYECKANSSSPGSIDWVLASPQADLVDRTSKTVAKYSGPPATWTHMGGSSVVGAQIAVAPHPGSTNLAYQLSKDTPGAAPGVMQNITFIQRVKTKGGQDFSKACTQADMDDKLTLPYQADYIFWKAA
jgi:Protein of unknown function (DUF3455)